MKIKISKAIFGDWCASCPDCAPYDRIDAPGEYEISEEERIELASQCEHHGNIGGDYIDPISSGLTRAYRSLYKQVKA